jgi:hypothetical protein
MGSIAPTRMSPSLFQSLSSMDLPVCLLHCSSLCLQWTGVISGSVWISVCLGISYRVFSDRVPGLWSLWFPSTFWPVSFLGLRVCVFSRPSGLWAVRTHSVSLPSLLFQAVYLWGAIGFLLAIGTSPNKIDCKIWRGVLLLFSLASIFVSVVTFFLLIGRLGQRLFFYDVSRSVG